MPYYTDDQLAREVETRVARQVGTFRKEFDSEFQTLIKSMKSDLQKEVSTLISQAFGTNSAMGDALAAGASSALGTIISGGKINPRTVANAAARTLVPEIQSFFSQSRSQMGGGLLDLIGSAQRNL